MTKESVTSEKYDTTRVQCESKSQRNNESRPCTDYKHRLRDKFKKSQAGTTNTLHYENAVTANTRIQCKKDAVSN